MLPLTGSTSVSCRFRACVPQRFRVGFAVPVRPFCACVRCEAQHPVVLNVLNMISPNGVCNCSKHSGLTVHGSLGANCRSALYGLLRTGRGRGSWVTAPRPGYRQSTVHGAPGVRGKGGGIVYIVPPAPKQGTRIISRINCRIPTLEVGTAS